MVLRTGEVGSKGSSPSVCSHQTAIGPASSFSYFFVYNTSYKGGGTPRDSITYSFIKQYCPM